MSLNTEVNPDIPAMLGASAALSISGAPFNGPMGACRVGYSDGQYTLNPLSKNLKHSKLDLVVAGTDAAVLMVESEAQELGEDVMLGAVVYGHEQLQTAVQAISEFADEVGVESWTWEAPAEDTELTAAVVEAGEARITAAYQISDKQARNDELNSIRDDIAEQLSAAAEGKEPRWTAGTVKGAVASVEKNIVRDRVIAGEPRIDGRDLSTVRALDVRVGVLPRTHGSALFTRGETQAIVVATLGTERDAQMIDAIEGERRDPFMLHYNFPPYCVGETGMVGSPKRREIGHGKLARRGVQAVLPSQEDFGYSMRVVSEITESNGSSSMASVCGTSLALMDAGVPLKAPVAGIAMGLVLNDAGEFAVLSDILGDEDHLGDMDFKVAGTEEGVTALQMDIKIQGITPEIMNQALTQARDGRLHILSAMNKVIDTPRDEVSDYAPRNIVLKIQPDKIRDVIGKGGATIRSITEETGTTIDITDDGTVTIWSVDKTAGNAALERVKQITSDIEVGTIYRGPIFRIMDFGALVSLMPGKDGLVHISQICEERVEKVTDKLSEGQVVNVKVIDVDRQGRIRLSMKDVPQEDSE